MKLTHYLAATLVVTTLAISCQAAFPGQEPLQGWLVERQEKPICDGVGDGYCQDENNNKNCKWDRWDCCKRKHGDWDSKCTDCNCYDLRSPNFDVNPERKCKDMVDQGEPKTPDECHKDTCDYCNGIIDDDENAQEIGACENYVFSLCRKTCDEDCSVDEPLADDKCLNVACSELWEDDDEYEGVCVDLYHNRWSNIEDTYDVSVDAKKVAANMGYGNKTLCKPSATAYQDPNRDCCRCFRKPKVCEGSGCEPLSCSDNGCQAQGGQCVNLLDADLTDPTKGPRGIVDLDERLADGLCHKPNKKHCCDCYLRKNETLIS